MSVMGSVDDSCGCGGEESWFWRGQPSSDGCGGEIAGWFGRKRRRRTRSGAGVRVDMPMPLCISITWGCQSSGHENWPEMRATGVISGLPSDADGCEPPPLKFVIASTITRTSRFKAFVPVQLATRLPGKVGTPGLIVSEVRQRTKSNPYRSE